MPTLVWIIMLPLAQEAASSVGVVHVHIRSAEVLVVMEVWARREWCCYDLWLRFGRAARADKQSRAEQRSMDERTRLAALCSAGGRLAASASLQVCKPARSVFRPRLAGQSILARSAQPVNHRQPRPSKLGLLCWAHSPHWRCTPPALWDRCHTSRGAFDARRCSLAAPAPVPAGLQGVHR